MNSPRPILNYHTPLRAIAASPSGAWLPAAMGVCLLLIVSGGAFGLMQSTALAGAIYAIGYCLLTWNRPALAMALIVASTPFQYDISAGGPLRFSLAEINLVLTLPMWLLGSRGGPGRQRAWLLGCSLGGYFGIAILSSLLHWRGNTALASILQMYLYMVVAVGMFAALGKRPENYVAGLLAFLAVCIPFAGLTLGMRSGHMLGLHKNGIGSTLAAGVVIGVELWFSQSFRYSRRFVAIATLASVGGLILSLSRGSWLAAATGVAFILLLRRQFRLLIKVGVALVPVIALAWAILPSESRDYALNFDKDTGASISARYENIEFARKYFLSSPILGVGVGLRKEFDATNILWVTLAETGVLGAVLFLAVQVSVVMMVFKLRRVVGPDDPRFTFVVLAGGLLIGRFAHGMFDHYWSRGAILVAWAAVGMLVRIYSEAAPRAAQRHGAIQR